MAKDAHAWEREYLGGVTFPTKEEIAKLKGVNEMSDTPISDAAMYVDDRGYEVVNLHVAQEFERKADDLQADARFWHDKYGQEIAATPTQHVTEMAKKLGIQKDEIESLRALATKFEIEAANERILRYAAEAERDAETERCAKIAREFQLSPVVGKAIAALIMEGKQPYTCDTAPPN